MTKRTKAYLVRHGAAILAAVALFTAGTAFGWIGSHRAERGEATGRCDARSAQVRAAF